MQNNYQKTFSGPTSEFVAGEVYGFRAWYPVPASMSKYAVVDSPDGTSHVIKHDVIFRGAFDQMWFSFKGNVAKCLHAEELTYMERVYSHQDIETVKDDVRATVAKICKIPEYAVVIEVELIHAFDTIDIMSLSSDKPIVSYIAENAIVYGKAKMPKPCTTPIDPNCTCGFYAYNSDEKIRNEKHHMFGLPIAGIIKGYGHTTIGEAGFRTEKADVVALYQHPNASPEAMRVFDLARDNDILVFKQYQMFLYHANQVLGIGR